MKGTRILLDPRRPEGLSFTSHAHSDHAPRGPVGKGLIASKETRSLLGLDDGGGREFHANGLRFRILNAGHILGSSQLCVEDGFTLVYTGDMNLSGGLTTGRAEVPRCDVLVLEATFGSPRYVFPPRTEVLGEIRDWAEERFAKGTRPVLLAYALGKAQELTRGLSKDLEVRVDGSVLKFHRRYEALGMELGPYGPYREGEDGDFILIAPPGMRKRLKGLPMAMVSGWAMEGGNAFRGYGVERAFPLSDHSDFPSLLEYVEEAQPQVVYTVHGFAGELSGELKARGFYSEPVPGRRYL